MNDVSLMSFEMLVALFITTKNDNTKQRWVRASQKDGIATEVAKRVSPH